MALAPQMQLVLGLTGGFGSGCTTIAEILSTKLGFHGEKLSDALRAGWAKHYDTEPQREQLQQLGDAMRREERSILAKGAVKQAEKAGHEISTLVLDGIRNLGEIEYLQERFGDRFYLLAVDAPTQTRWERVRDDYATRGLAEPDFYADDARDKDEETAWGQQVQLCVDRSDVLILNGEARTGVQRLAHFEPLLREYVGLLTSKNLRYPTLDEVLMNTAFSAAHQTRCLKRQVGAVIATTAGEPISVGFNENPDRIKPCVDQFQECFRDRLRNEHFAALAARKASCPSCGHEIRKTIGPPWRCACHTDNTSDCDCRTNLERDFFPDRAMAWCTALHAEERAILNARGRDLIGTVLYTTAFPCFLCAEKILQAGIEHIIFTEAYPDPYSGELLEAADPPVTITKFEGVRSGRFDRIFGGVRAHKEAEINERRREAI